MGGKNQQPYFQTYLQNQLSRCPIQGFGFLKNRIWQPDWWREWGYNFWRNKRSFPEHLVSSSSSPGCCQLQVWCSLWERAADYTWLNKIFWFASLSLGKMHSSAPTSAMELIKVLGCVYHRGVKKEFWKPAGVAGRWVFESLRDFPFRLHSNRTDLSLADSFHCSMSKTFTWNVRDVNLDTPCSLPMWPSLLHHHKHTHPRAEKQSPLGPG